MLINYIIYRSYICTTPWYTCECEISIWVDSMYCTGRRILSAESIV